MAAEVQRTNVCPEHGDWSTHQNRGCVEPNILVPFFHFQSTHGASNTAQDHYDILRPLQVPRRLMALVMPLDRYRIDLRVGGRRRDRSSAILDRS